MPSLDNMNQLAVAADRRYGALAEVRDLAIHIDRFITGYSSGLYVPHDDDFTNLVEEFRGVSAQLRVFISAKEDALRRG